MNERSLSRDLTEEKYNSNPTLSHTLNHVVFIVKRTLRFLFIRLGEQNNVIVNVMLYFMS